MKRANEDSESQCARFGEGSMLLVCSLLCVGKPTYIHLCGEDGTASITKTLQLLTKRNHTKQSSCGHEIIQMKCKCFRFFIISCNTVNFVCSVNMPKFNLQDNLMKSDL